MCDMFLILNTTYFTGFADGNTPFVVRDNIAGVIKAGNRRKPCKLVFE